MPSVSDVLDAIEQVAPARFAFSFDHIGLQVGDPSAKVARIAVALDPSLAAARFARKHGAQMLVCHHPLIWDPLETLRADTYKGRIVKELIEGGVAFAAAHTNWDCARGGINDVLAEMIGLQSVSDFGSSADEDQVKVVVTVPKGGEEGLIEAMSMAGAGEIGLYERCAFVSTGTGTFRGKPDSSSAIGKPGQIESVDETKVEMVCRKDISDSVVNAIIGAHPYEQPAIDVYALQKASGQRAGRIGSLRAPMPAKDFISHLDLVLATRTLLSGGKDDVQRVAVVGGAASGDWQAAKGAGADAFVTGEVPHHVMVEASESGLAIAACGHYATENPGTMRLGEFVAEATGIELLKFEPGPGMSGRPL